MFLGADGTRSHGSEGGRAWQRAWELVDNLSITCYVVAS